MPCFLPSQPATAQLLGWLRNFGELDRVGMEGTGWAPIGARGVADELREGQELYRELRAFRAREERQEEERSAEAHGAGNRGGGDGTDGDRGKIERLGHGASARCGPASEPHGDNEQRGRDERGTDEPG